MYIFGRYTESKKHKYLTVNCNNGQSDSQNSTFRISLKIKDDDCPVNFQHDTDILVPVQLNEYKPEKDEVKANVISFPDLNALSCTQDSLINFFTDPTPALKQIINHAFFPIVMSVIGYIDEFDVKNSSMLIRVISPEVDNTLHKLYLQTKMTADEIRQELNTETTQPIEFIFHLVNYNTSGPISHLGELIRFGRLIPPRLAPLPQDLQFNMTVPQRDPNRRRSGNIAQPPRNISTSAGPSQMTSFINNNPMAPSGMNAGFPNNAPGANMPINSSMHPGAFTGVNNNNINASFIPNQTNQMQQNINASFIPNQTNPMQQNINASFIPNQTNPMNPMQQNMNASFIPNQTNPMQQNINASFIPNQMNQMNPMQQNMNASMAGNNVNVQNSGQPKEVFKGTDSTPLNSTQVRSGPSIPPPHILPNTSDPVMNPMQNATPPTQQIPLTTVNGNLVSTGQNNNMSFSSIPQFPATSMGNFNMPPNSMSNIPPQNFQPQFYPSNITQSNFPQQNPVAQGYPNPNMAMSAQNPQMFYQPSMAQAGNISQFNSQTIQQPAFYPNMGTQNNTQFQFS